MIDVSTIQTSFVLSQQLTVFISIYEMKHLILWWLGPQLSYKDWGYGKLVHYLYDFWFLVLVTACCLMYIPPRFKSNSIEGQFPLFFVLSISFLIYRFVLSSNKILMRMMAINEINYLKSFCLFDWLTYLLESCQALVPNPQSRGLGLTIKSYGPPPHSRLLTL